MHTFIKLTAGQGIENASRKLFFYVEECTEAETEKNVVK